ILYGFYCLSLNGCKKLSLAQVIANFSVINL
ncbi:hypothetical protein cje100_07715, partial [Campylobacter jejuni subsp. jejuni LMG 23216]